MSWILRVGLFRVRGDTIDIFPAEHADLAVRLSMFDDEIESIQLFDPLTGSGAKDVAISAIYPSNAYVTPRVRCAVRRSRMSCVTD